MSELTKVDNGRLQTVEDLEQRLGEEKKMRKVMNGYIEEELTEGVDYGTIEIKGTQSKPSLFKPGSEKLIKLFRLRPVFSRDSDTWEMLGSREGTICYKCELISQNGEVVGEGRGASVAKPEQDFDVNKQIKIAEKRAQVDAVLRVFNLSERFTQDIEDMPQKTSNSRNKSQSTREKARDRETDDKSYQIKRLYAIIGQEDLDPRKKTVEIALALGKSAIGEFDSERLEKIANSIEEHGTDKFIATAKRKGMERSADKFLNEIEADIEN